LAADNSTITSVIKVNNLKQKLVSQFTTTKAILADDKLAMQQLYNFFNILNDAIHQSEK
jgi:hypothetical protein